MLPFTIDNMILDMFYEMDEISKNIVKYKYKFCIDLEKELSLDVSEYSQNIFDYLFNLMFFKKAFTREDLRKYLNEFKGLDFKNISEVSSYINIKYGEFVIKYKNYFMDYFEFSHEDPLYIQRKIHDKKNHVYEKMLSYY